LISTNDGDWKRGNHLRIKEKHGEDWLNDVADGFSMAFI
jgi:hypothetical protein